MPPLDGTVSEYVTVARELPTKEREPSLDGLIAWLETMPPDGEYDFMDCHGGCLFGQYAKHVGEKVTYCDMQDVYGIPTGNIACDSPRTFGAALERARAVRGG